MLTVFDLKRFLAVQNVFDLTCPVTLPNLSPADPNQSLLGIKRLSSRENCGLYSSIGRSAAVYGA